MSQQPMKRYWVWADCLFNNKPVTKHNERDGIFVVDVADMEAVEELLDHTETDRDGLEGLLKELAATYGCKRYTEAVHRAKAANHALAAKEAVCESYAADRKLAVAGERQCFTTYQCAHRQRTIKQLTADLARLEQRVKELEGNAIVAENRLIAAYNRIQELNHD